MRRPLPARAWAVAAVEDDPGDVRRREPRGIADHVHDAKEGPSLGNGHPGTVVRTINRSVIAQTPHFYKTTTTTNDNNNNTHPDPAPKSKKSVLGGSV